jgi:ABC-type proline/glycine betaine transport system substrate-binding protein
VSELEEMMYRHENKDVSWEKLAAEWIDNHPEEVERMLGT